MTPLQQEPSAHAPWMRTIFGRAFISGIPSWSFPDDRADPTMPSSPVGRYPQRYCTSDKALRRARPPPRALVHEREEKPLAVPKIKFFYLNGPWWHIPESLRARRTCAVRLRIPRLQPCSARWPQDTTAKGPEMNVPGMNDQRDLEGLSALVTGATSGIGRAA